MTDLIVAAQLFSTLFMTGLIWFVQVVHYPLYSDAGRNEFPTYQRRHQRLTTFVVGPVMLLEVASAVAWLYWLPGESDTLMWISIFLLIVIWVSTAVLQVPAHGRLAQEYSDSVQRHLVRTNWIRTVAWTIRSGIVLWIALQLKRVTAS